MQTTVKLKHSASAEDKDCLTSLNCSHRKYLSEESLPSATVECLAENSRTTSQDKSHSCERNTLTQTSSRTSAADSTSEEKDCKPFYNDFCKEISSHLLSHTEIDSAASDSNSSSSCLNKMVGKSWFSITQMYHHNKSSQRICSQFFMSSHAEYTDYVSTRTKSRRIRIYPTQQQKTLFKQWFGISRKFYNETVNHYNDKDKDTVNWMEIGKRLTHSHTEDYVKIVPYQIKKIAVKDCYNAFKNGCKKAKMGEGRFDLKYRTRKDPKQSCYIPKQALTANGIYHSISGTLKMKERHLIENYEHADLRLVMEYGKWFVMVPFKFGDMRLSVSENQGTDDVVSLDPGIRNFLTYFSENGHFGKLGIGFDKIMSLQYRIDKLISLRSTVKEMERRSNLRRSIGRLKFRLHNIVDELHWKCINYLVRNYRVILLPTFEVSDMVKRGGRKINKTVVRAMQSYRFYEFGERLRVKCEEYGVTLLRVNEAYTSKTNSFNGDVFNIGSRSSFVYDGVTVDRDINGARNILLRAMRDSSFQG